MNIPENQNNEAADMQLEEEYLEPQIRAQKSSSSQQDQPSCANINNIAAFEQRLFDEQEQQQLQK